MEHFRSRNIFEKALLDNQKEGWPDFEEGLDEKGNNDCEEYPELHFEDMIKGHSCSHKTCKPKPKYNSADCDKCFGVVNKNLTELYIKLAEALSKKLDCSGAGFGDLLGPQTTARKILDRAISKISKIERYEEDPRICEELIDAIGKLAVNLISLAVQHERMDGFLELFEEGLNALLRKSSFRPRRRSHRSHRRRWPTRSEYESSSVNNTYSDSCEVASNPYSSCYSCQRRSRRYTIKY